MGKEDKNKKKNGSASGNKSNRAGQHQSPSSSNSFNVAKQNNFSSNRADKSKKGSSSSNRADQQNRFRSLLPLNALAEAASNIADQQNGSIASNRADKSKNSSSASNSSDQQNGSRSSNSSRAKNNADKRNGQSAHANHTLFHQVATDPAMTPKTGDDVETRGNAKASGNDGDSESSSDDNETSDDNKSDDNKSDDDDDDGGETLEEYQERCSKTMLTRVTWNHDEIDALERASTNNKNCSNGSGNFDYAKFRDDTPELMRFRISSIKEKVRCNIVVRNYFIFHVVPLL